MSFRRSQKAFDELISPVNACRVLVSLIMPRKRHTLPSIRTSWAGALLLLIVMTPLSLRAQLLAFETWDYDTGTDNASGQTGGSGWNGGWQSISNDANVSAGSLTPTGDSATLLTGGNSVFLPSGNFHRIGRELDVSNGGVFDTAGYLNGSGDIGADGTTLYLSFLMKTGATDGFFEFEFHRNNLGDPGRIGGVGDDANGSNFNLRTPSLGRANAFATRTTDTQFVVVQFDFLSGSDSAAVYLNPVLGSAPTADLSLTGAGDLSFDGISLAGGNDEIFDEIRFGSTYAAVTPSSSAVPEPSSYAALLSAAVLMSATARRRRRN